MASITDHVIKLQELTQKNLDILQALNDSFFTNQNHLSVNIGEQQYAIPSFISLENKLNSLTANFENLVKSPETGEAFFDFNGNSRAIQVRSYSEAPNSLVLKPISEFGVETNNIFKDFLTPNPYIHLDVQSLPNDTTQVLVKKIIPIHSELKQMFESYLGVGREDQKVSIRYDYKDLYKILNSYVKDVDYIEYDSRMDLPIRKNIGSGIYVIEDILEDIIDENLDNFLTIKIRNDINDSTYMNSLKYRLFDETIEKMLKVGDELVTYEGNAKLSITEIYPTTNTIVVKVMHGEFLNLVPSITNIPNNISSLSKLKFYSPIDFNKDKYIRVPLEEDQFIFTAVAALNPRMNIQSPWGGGLMINTYSLIYNDKDFQTYYKENVKNVGDILMEITNMTASPLTKYTKEEYDEFTKYQPELITDNLQVVQINKHLNNSIVVQNIRSLYTQKIELQNQLSEIQTQINEINETLSSISFDDTTGRRTAYIQSLSSLNIRKNELNTSITKIINEISLAANNSEIPIENAKYRIRGYFDINDNPWKDHIKGIRVQYRYKNVDSTQNSAYTINDKFIFSDWNEMNGSDREMISTYNNEYKSQLSPVTDNVNEPSFNQIDIPISQGETVDIRLKIIYDYGYPFVQTSSSWSSIVNIGFPSEFLKDVKILDIISENNNDIETNRFNNIIKEEGIPEHISDKLIDQDITYFHKPENISSGFYTQERRIIPLKDKLTEMSNLITQLQDEILGSNTDKLTVSIKNGDKYIPLTKFDNNIIYLDSYSKIKNNEVPGNYIMQKNGIVTTVLNLSLANDSNHIIKLHSIFPGSRDIAINQFASTQQNNLAHYTTGDVSTLKNRLGVWLDIPVEGNYLNENYVTDTGSNERPVVNYEPKSQYLTFEVLESGTFSFSQNNIDYSLDGGSKWTTLTAGSRTPTISAGSKVMWRATDPSISRPENFNIMGVGNAGMGTFSSTGKFNVEGNIMSLLYGDKFEDEVGLTDKDCAFYGLFANCNIQSAKNLILPATSLADGCYAFMFQGCTSLVIAPELSATTLANYCYSNMFDSCSSLTTAPELPATTLALCCYIYMFQRCTSLVTAPELPATSLADGCYAFMFYGCKFTTVPVLPATSLAKYCYNSMFYSCTNLTTTSELPATTLADSCYAYMFQRCTSLVTAPELPAMSLANSCYHSMFYDCSSLATSPKLPATILAERCYGHMFINCTSLNNITMLATDINATDCLDNWVSGVTSTGKFTKASSMTTLPTGNSGIPEGWTVEDYVNPQSQYLTFEVREDGTFSFSQNNIDYSLDGGSTWTTLTAGSSTPTISAGSKVMWRATDPTISSSTGIGTFSSTGKFNVSGNIMSLLYGDNFIEQIDLTGKSHTFYNLFKNCNNLIYAHNLILPATTLASNCYRSMFQACTSLITSPKLPATSLAEGCYSGMFAGCTSLTTVPKLPATTLAPYCYNYIFLSCTSLTTVPKLPATTLASNCYRSMFQDCSSLTIAPVLPATTLAEGCYTDMFNRCISLTIAPVLPATTLAKSCYDSMFRYCSSLVTSPKLHTTTLAEGCYAFMFDGCSKLNNITMLATDISATDCLTKWVSSVASIGTFTKASSMTTLPTGIDGIPEGWTVEDYVATPDTDTDGDDSTSSGDTLGFEHIITEEKNNKVISRQMLQTGNQYLYFRVDDVNTHDMYYGETKSIETDLIPENNLLSFNPEGIKWSRFESTLKSSMKNNTDWYDKYFHNLKLINKLMFVYPKLTSKYGLCVDKDESNMILYPNDEIIIPIVVEFHVSDITKRNLNDLNSPIEYFDTISKTMSFDIRPSLYKDPINYKFTIVSKYENSIQEDILANQQESYSKSNSKYNIIFK